jgi:hypothetical protein
LGHESSAIDEDILSGCPHEPDRAASADLRARAIGSENAIIDSSQCGLGLGLGFIQDRRLRADMFFIRAQSTIRADGAPSAQVRTLQLEVFSYVRQCRRTAIARYTRQPRFWYGSKAHPYQNHGYG